MDGIRRDAKRLLKSLNAYVDPDDRFVPADLAEIMAGFSEITGRQLGVLLDRRGAMDAVLIGSPHRVYLPSPEEIGGRRHGLVGLRYLHTHLTGRGLDEEDLSDMSLHRFDFVALICPGKPPRYELAHLNPDAPQRPGSAADFYTRYPPRSWGEENTGFTRWVREFEASHPHSRRDNQRQRQRQRAVLLCVALNSKSDIRQDETEIRELCASMNIDIVHTMVQKHFRPHPKTFIGKGKTEELMVNAVMHDADVCLLNAELNPAQTRNLNERISIDIMDKTNIILNIFSRHASSNEGKIKVELAQQRYLLPRIGEGEKALSRISHVGAKGSGETMHEIKKRRITQRILHLKKSLRRIENSRDQRRHLRQKNRVPLVAIVGYTNAGKSSLLNTLTGSCVPAQDKLFATLDVSSKRLTLDNGENIIFIDTVGFIRDLPQTLLDAFKSTLEEIREADLILHVMDCSSRHMDERYHTVGTIISELGAGDIPRLNVINKIDRVPPLSCKAAQMRYDGLVVSATESVGIRELIIRVRAELDLTGQAERRETAPML